MSLNFTINGKLYKVEPNELPADTTLNNYIREHANLTGTKFMCLEGGCGVCVCVIKGRHPVSKEYQTWATNSCLTMLYSCDGWDIVTIEGLGSKIKGYHPIQERLAHLNGSQCGYCSPAMVMNMYGLLEGRGKISMKEVQNSFGGSICRCTGYRPILDAMGSFASDSDYEFVCKDIEDIGKICPKTGSACGGMCKSSKLDVVTKDGTQWISAFSLKDIFDAFGKIGDKKYMLVAGNTGHGVFRRDPDIEVFIDVNKVPELHTHNVGDTLELGGNLSLTETMDIFTAAATKPGYEYLTKVYDHFDVIANVPVRNMGTLAGNLSMKHAVKGFPSDIFLTFEAVDAKIVVAEDPSKTATLSVQEYLATDMKKKVLKGFILPNYDPKIYFFNSYKIMPRAQNAHAYVNGAFLVKCTNDKIDWARLCFGGITEDFIHAKKTEDYVTGKDIFDNAIFKKSMEILKTELNPDWVLPDASPDYRRLLACGLYYKYVIGVTPNGKIKPEFKSGGPKLQRDVSSGTQTFETNSKIYPLTEPMPKMEALVQCSGEATYMNDYPNVPHQLWAAFVHATEANSKIAKIDESEALKVPGVVAFYSAKDIPGVNSFVTKGLVGMSENEEIFCSGTVKYHAQPIGMIVAESTKIATMAADKVKVMYEKQAGVVMATLDDVLEHKATHRMTDTIVTPDRHIPDLVNATKKVTGELNLGSQYHFTMEPQTTVCIPTEDGMEVFSATQFIDNSQTSIANALNVNVNSIHLNVRRLGGGYGAKVSRANQIGCAAALACQKLGRPIRFVQTIESMMSSLGKRFACHSDYEVDVDDKGKIIKLKNNFYEDSGCTVNESPVNFLTVHCVKNCYINGDNWIINGKEVITDAPSHTWCRAPGALEGIAMAETIIEHIARETNRDPVDVRLENIAKDHKLSTLIPDYMNTVEYKKRKEEIMKFNTENRWRKRGLGVAVMQYPIDYFGQFGAMVTIYHGDGTVGVTHGGIEMGQGIHTKAAQVAAHILGIPLSKVKVEPSDSFTSPNNAPTGATIGSECVAYATKKACEDLLERLKPIRESMKNPTWEELIDKAFQQNVNLLAQNSAKRGDIEEYGIYGVACSEIEVDILTGNLIVKRVDILEDTGESLSPMIDVGQVESAFIMGLGYWLTEQLVFNRETGELLTTRTWNYKVPGPKDIPVDFRVNLLQKSPNSAGVLRSKATGEPPMCLSISILFALRQALDSSREQSGVKEKWFHLGAPTTPEHIMLNAGITPEMFSLV